MASIHGLHSGGGGPPRPGDGTSSSAPAQQQPNWFVSWWARTPALCRALLLCEISLSLLAMFVAPLAAALVSSPALFLRGHVWRPLTGLLFEDSFFGLLLTLILAALRLPDLERSGGTVKLAANILAFGLIINVMHAAVMVGVRVCVHATHAANRTRRPSLAVCPRFPCRASSCPRCPRRRLSGSCRSCTAAACLPSCSRSSPFRVPYNQARAPHACASCCPTACSPPSYSPSCACSP
ncbi:MAG: hypothetical protein EOO41_02875 [Methanobacteriota archaeon]|nr:MAG: hypothetical protein EOO41_02875 [Euryarchaeota archaeon]